MAHNVKDEQSKKILNDNSKHYFSAAWRVQMQMSSYIFCPNVFKLQIMHAADQKKLMNGFIVI